MDLTSLIWFYIDMLGTILWRNSIPLSDDLAMKLLQICLIVV